MDPSYFATLFDYNVWARDRLLRSVQGLRDAEYFGNRAMDYGSVHGTLAHAYGAEVMWFRRWHGESPARMLGGDDIATLGELVAAWHAHEGAMHTFLGSLNDEQLYAPVAYRSTSGESWTRPLWETMAHLINHGTNHRSEVAAVATQLGHSPGDLDMIVFFNERGTPT